MIQKQVNLYGAEGVPGERASLNPIVYTWDNYLADGEVQIASFAWASATKEGFASQGGIDAPLGFVERWMAYPLLDKDIQTVNGVEGVRAALTAPDGCPLTVARRGDFYAVATTAATVGQKVFANSTDGTIATDAAGAAVGGHVETNFTVQKAGAVGELIVISNWD